MDSAFIPVVSCITVLLCIYLWPRKTRPLPPGPRRWPVLGNALDMPKEKEWLTYTEWGKTYGDIVYLSMFGRSIVILNSANVALDLLHKRSSKYSDRPYLAMGGELVGYDRSLSLIRYGQRFRDMRRLIHRILSPGPAQAFWTAEEQITSRFLSHLLENPEKFLEHIRHMAGAVILGISHGYTVSGTNDPLVNMAEEALDNFSASTTPGVFLVDLFPWLKYVPSWFPGATFRRIAIEWRNNLFRMADAAHNFTKDQLEKGNALPSFTSNNLEGTYTPETESLVKWTAFSLYGGGADTTVSTVASFFLAMCIHPEIQTLAQAELDAIVGNERLPTMADRPSLPYIEAIMKETLRWGPVVPGAVAHRLTHDDEYQGYSFAAGTLFIPNIWGMLHDSDHFPNPHEFRPERFMRSNQEQEPSTDPLQIVFGFGRRVCPGQHLAEPSLFLSIAMTLSTFTISKARDKQTGEIIEPAVEWTSGTISHPKPFRCEIKPRSDRAMEVIKHAVKEDNQK